MKNPRQSAESVDETFILARSTVFYLELTFFKSFSSSGSFVLILVSNWSSLLCRSFLLIGLCKPHEAPKERSLTVPYEAAQQRSMAERVTTGNRQKKKLEEYLYPPSLRPSSLRPSAVHLWRSHTKPWRSVAVSNEAPKERSLAERVGFEPTVPANTGTTD